MKMKQLIHIHSAPLLCILERIFETKGSHKEVTGLSTAQLVGWSVMLKFSLSCTFGSQTVYMLSSELRGFFIA